MDWNKVDAALCLELNIVFIWQCWIGDCCKSARLNYFGDFFPPSPQWFVNTWSVFSGMPDPDGRMLGQSTGKWWLQSVSPCKGLIKKKERRKRKGNVVCFFAEFRAQQMLLLCQGVNGMRKDGESVVWNHHKQSFQGESLTVNASPQTHEMNSTFQLLASPKRDPEANY